MRETSNQVLPAPAATTLDGLSLAQCEREIVDLHAFFQAWLDASLPATDAAFDRFTATAHPQFTLISPDGKMARRTEAAAWIRAAHGTRPGVRLWTTNHTLHHADGSMAIMTYREWQTNAGVTTLRLSTAVLCAAPGTPNGVAWLHVHETWMQDPDGPATGA